MTSDDQQPVQPANAPDGAPSTETQAPTPLTPAPPMAAGSSGTPGLDAPPTAPAPFADIPPAPAAPIPGDLPPAAPGGLYPAGAFNYGTPAAPFAPAPRKRRGLISGAIIGAVAVIGGLLLKFGLPILIGTAASGVLSGFFGGPFDRLPSDQRKALEQRIDAAIGDSLKDLSDAAASAKVTAMIGSGLPRLDDALLSEKIHLTVKLLNGADVATCARIARATASGAGDSDAIKTALGTMDTTSVGRWFEINVSAIEAEAKGAPPARTVATSDSDRVLGGVIARFSTVQTQEITDLYQGKEIPDAGACDAFRALYGHIDELPAADLAIAALYDVTP
jgi:hypothetical protein